MGLRPGEVSIANQNSDGRIKLLLLAAGFSLSLVYVFLTPAWQAPDEPSHLAYVLFLRNTGAMPSPLKTRLPPAIIEEASKELGWTIVNTPLPRRAGVLPADDFAARGLIYTANHPPLYYFLAGIFGRLVALFTRDALPGFFYGARLLSAVLTAITVVLAFQIAREFNLSAGESAFIALLVMLQPQFMFISSSVNNDALTVTLFSLLVLFLIKETNASAPRISLIVCGAVIGLGLLTKVTFWLSLPIAWFAFLAAAGESRPIMRQAARALSATALGAALSAWWYVRNLLIYGKVWYVIGGTGFGRATAAEFFSVSFFYRFLFRTYWGFFGWLTKPLPPVFYWVLLVVCLIGAAGFSLQILTVEKERRRGAVIAVAVISLFLGAILFRIVALTGQGRYLFPVIVPVTMLLWLGVKFWAKERYPWAAAMLLAFFGALTIEGLSLIAQL